MASQLANFATGAGVFDATIYGDARIDSSPFAGTGDLSLNAASSQYLKTTTAFTTSSAVVGNGITFSGWFYPSNSQTVGSTIFDISTATIAVSLFYGTSSTMTGFFNGTDVSSTYVVLPNMWHFFCYTIYCTTTLTALQTLYVDSPSVNKATQSSTNYTSITSTGNNYLGYGAGSAAGLPYQYFNGKLDDFRFYNRVLSLPEINVLYNYNYATNTIANASIAVTPYYDVSYANVVQIDVTGTFSGFDISRNPAFPTANVLSLTCTSLSSLDGTTWSYFDKTVTPDTSYTYIITPSVVGLKGSMVTMSTTYTTPILNGFFNSLTSGSLPTINTGVASPALLGWTVSLGSGNTYTLCSGTGVVSAITTYSGTLPSLITYYASMTMLPSTVTTMYQYVNLYYNTNGYVSFYAWPMDASYNSNTSLTVSIGGITLLNAYTFDVKATGAVPYTSFNLPFSMNTVGSYPLTFQYNNANTLRASICVAGVQIRLQSTAGIGYKTVDPSMMTHYYTFDASSGTNPTKIYNYTTGVGVLDASLSVNANVNTGKLYTDGTANTYTQLSNWTCPANVVSKGFSMTGWVYPTVAMSAQASNATICSFTLPTTGNVSIYLKQQTGQVTFSTNAVNNTVNANAIETVISSYPLPVNRWSFLSMTCGGNGTTGNYNFYINDVSLSFVAKVWPNVTSSYTANYLGGVPSTTTIAAATGNLGNFAGYMEDFRVYNRELSSQDVFALWSFGLPLTTTTTSSSYANLIDTSGLNLYFSFDQGTMLV
jgi:hypothetical protein